MNRPLLIGFHGIDGAGKTTQIRLLRGHLTELGYQVEMSEAGTQCRQEAHRIARMLGKENAYELFDVELLTFCGALEYLRSVLYKVSVPAGRGLHCIIFDKYIDSFKATAVSRGQRDFSQVEPVFRAFPPLDLKLYLNIDLQSALARIRGREGGLYENETPRQLGRFHDALQGVMAEAEGVVVIDASRSVLDVHTAIAAAARAVIHPAASVTMGA